MKGGYLWGIIVVGAILLVALCGLSITAGDLLHELLQPDRPQTADADAKLAAASRCNGLIVIGCNVAAEQQQEQRQQQTPSAPKRMNVLELAGMVFIILFAGLITLVLTCR